MKKQMIFFALLVSFIIGNAQPGNVGIGTNLPVYKLHVHDAGSVNTFMSLTNSGTGTSASDGLFIGMAGNNGTVANLENGNLRLGTNNLTRIMIDAAGNVGIGNLVPNYKLDLTGVLNVNGSMRLEGLNLFEFGAGVTGKEINAGKIGYNAFGQSALTFIGAGTNGSNRAVYFYAEGGTTFGGPINVGGTIAVNGNPGISGQVLTSNGASSPIWGDAAFTNNTRFKVDFHTYLAGSGNMDLISTDYNLNTTNIAIGSNSFTVNKTGLYRISGSIYGYTNYIPANEPVWKPELECSLVFGTYNYRVAFYDNYIKRNSAALGNHVYHLSKQFTVDIHLVAGTVVRVSKNFYWNGSPTLSSAGVELVGNLIAE